MAKKANKTKSSKKSKSQESLLVGSKVKALLKKAGCNTAGDALEGLNGLVSWYISQAAARAKSNGRKTVRSHDFMSQG